MDRLPFTRSRQQTAGFVLGAAAFVVTGYFMARFADSLFHRAAGWAAVAFFGAVFISASHSFIRGGDVFVFDRGGIADRHRGVVIAWDEIDEVVVITVKGARFLGLVFHDSARFLSRVSPLQRLWAGFNERMGWCCWNLTFSGVTPGIDQALQYVRDNVPGVRCPRSGLDR